MGATVAIFQHAASDGPGYVETWLRKRGFAVETVRWWEQTPPRHPEHWRGVVILGGAMNIYQHRDYPWLVEEKKLLRQLLEQKLPLVGICLGAQLLADQLGSRVVQNPEREIGWWPVFFTTEGRRHFPHLPESCPVLHWHGDTFGLPPGSVRLATSAACGEQGFLFEERVLGWQFHPEVDAALLQDFCGDSTETWPTGAFVQSRETLLDQGAAYFSAAHAVLEGCLEKIFGRPELVLQTNLPAQ